MASPEIQALKARATDAGVDIAVVLRDAGVAQSTWSRWNSGAFDPRFSTLRKIQAALDNRIGGKAA